ncbi:hypothetical protein K2173_019438 [Erythroxylum novogranatense]|uniref:Uncharacterized protein n=1 Tax=Erythroxylum novogranatense TaxID=1862640 RepID=A0AAV8UCK8_9ROSI|nr:hypothetical protein K2173_019438 [Erythroxylum novogranatense]
MSNSVKIYDTCIRCTQSVRAYPINVLEMIHRFKANQIASTLRMEDYVSCKMCDSAGLMDFLSIQVYL